MRGIGRRTLYTLSEGGNMKLYEIDSMLEEAIAIAIQQAEESEGEITTDWAEFMEAIELERDQKILNVARYIKNIKADAEALKAEKIKLGERQAVLENRVNSMKSFLLLFLKEGEKVSDETAAVSTRNNAAAVILSDDFDIPEEFQIVSVSADKKAIKEALNLGKKIDGALLKSSRSVTIK